MARRQWTTEDQYAWLLVLIPNFLKAQDGKWTQAFYEDTYRNWHRLWPTPPPTEGEIEAAGGNTERALARKQKEKEIVRVH